MYDSMTVVDTDELMELKKQAEEINKRIAELTAPKNIAYRCKVKPYRLPSFLDNDARNPVVFTDRCYDTDAWAHFLALGKMIQAENGVFKTRGTSWRREPFYVDELGKNVPKKVSDLTQEEVRISAEMLEKMISIYNEYMVQMHACVTLDCEGILAKVQVQYLESGTEI